MGCCSHLPDPWRSRQSALACGFCHRVTGTGGPENADLAGLPKSYIIQQLADYKSGARGTTLPARTPPKLMIELSQPMTVGEIEAAATYFSALQPRKRIKVVESDTAPKTNVAGLLWTRWKPESASRSERGS
jgi:cytochrome c553